MTYKNKQGFTLAEVLITLGIIGVVAAMTLPSIINNSRNKQLEAQLKKSQSVITQGLLRMAGEEGQIVNSINYSNAPFRVAFVKYFQNAKDCNLTDCVTYGDEDDGNGGVNSFIIKNYRTFNNFNTIQTMHFDDGQFQLQDGMMVLIENPDTVSLNSRMFITVDINGMNKKPNRWGHDLFTFQVLRDGKLVPMGIEGSMYTQEQYCSATSVDRMNGIACTFKALTDKDYWKNLPK